jgi:probable F420-dependent oxidoreductase
MDFAIAFPQFVDDGAFDPVAVGRYLTRAEQLGFHSAWTMEQVLGTAPSLSPLEALTFAAACTDTLRLGCVVFVTPLHSPVHLAKGLASLDQISRGRLEIGVGTGGRGRMFSAFGVDPATLVARFNEGLAVMKGLWTEPRLTFEGRFWQLDGAAMEPKPFQKPHPPVWFGGNAPAALRRAVRHGDGFFGAGSQTTEQFVGQVQVVREALAEQGRDPATFPIAKRVYLAVGQESVKERLGAALRRVYSYLGARDIEAVGLAGSPAECADGLRAVAAAGAELILLNPLFDEAEQLERLAAEVIPQVVEAG